jgi:putative glutamine amidotransferase
MSPLIGISARSVVDEPWCPPLVGARKGYIDAVVAAGGVPVVLPPVDDPRALRGMFDALDGLLLTGGVDVAPELYGEQPHPRLGAVQAERDAAEMPLARWAAAEGKPIFGICRGIQVLNVALGGTLYQDLPAQRPGEIDHELSIKHECWDRFDHGLALARDSRLAGLLQTTMLDVNSLHHQAVKDLGSGLRVVGQAPDGVVEAIEGTGGHFVVGVQCHPEGLWQSADVRWRAVFRAFVEAAERYHDETAERRAVGSLPV